MKGKSIIQEAVELVAGGIVKAVEVDGAKIYRVKNIVRIDIKVEEPDYESAFEPRE